MTALDDSDPRVNEGLRISVASILYMKRQAAAAGIDFLVMLIPTKEYAYQKYFLESGANSESMVQVWGAERKIKTTLLQAFNLEGIKVIDPIGAFEAKIAHGINPYPIKNGKPQNDADGHPRAGGYKIIASQVAEALTHKTLRSMPQ